MQHTEYTKTEVNSNTINLKRLNFETNIFSMPAILFFLMQQSDTLSAASDTLSTAVGAGPAVAGQQISFFELMVKGGWLMIPIFALSIVMVYVIAERWKTLKAAQTDVDDFLNTISEMLKDGNRERALTYCDSVDKPISRILTAGIRRLGRPLQDIEEAIKKEGKKETYHLEKRMTWLATIAAVEPLLGFTGTVTGLIEAFMSISTLGGAANPSILAGGVYEALITTAAGLIIGIIALGAYNFFLNKINRMVFELENASTEFIEVLQSPTINDENTPVA